jgi:hypothetical protein
MDLREFENNINQLQALEAKSWAEAAKARHLGDTASAQRLTEEMLHYNQATTTAMEAESRKLDAQLKLDPGADDDAKVIQLLDAFVTGAVLSRIWYDTLAEREVSNSFVRKLIFNVVNVLDAMGRRDDLAKFLTHPDLGVRARAAFFLIDTMPDRCIPLLREIRKTERWLDAGYTALLTLRRYAFDHPENKDAQS